MYGTCTSLASTYLHPNAKIQLVSRPLSTPEPSPFRYQVRQGDTLTSIAAQFRTTEHRLLQLNPRLNGNEYDQENQDDNIRLYPGQQLAVEDLREVKLPPSPECIDHGWGQMHVVSASDSLSTIAALYNTTEELLRQDNRKFFPAGERGALRVGQLLYIRRVHIGVDANSSQSEETFPPDPSSQFTTHFVTARDTFASICQAYDVSFDRLLALNRGRFPIGARVTLQLGEQLVVPDRYARLFQPQAQRRNVAEIRLTKQLHVVQYGDTPSAIAARFRMTLDELREWNRVFFPKGCRGEIRVGDRLVVRRLEAGEYRTIRD